MPPVAGIHVVGVAVADGVGGTAVMPGVGGRTGLPGMSGVSIEAQYAGNGLNYRKGFCGYFWDRRQDKPAATG